MTLKQMYRRLLRVVMGPEPEPRAPGPGGGLVIVADGIGALGVCSHVLIRLIRRSGLPHQVEIHDWHHGFGRWLLDLRNSRQHRRMTTALANRIQTFREAFPDRPVYLVGKSGGAGLVVWALESLPPGSIDRAFLVAPAISPGYDLRPALQAVQGELIVFHSVLDFMLLGLGTSVFGTIDGVWGVSAGLIGFRPNAAMSAEEQAKLRQVGWSPSRLRELWLGGHFSVDWPPFLRRNVLPCLEVEVADERALIDVPSSAGSPASGPPSCSRSGSGG